jgi:hypothetical protein
MHDVVLRDYQVEARDWLEVHPKSILADEVGLGQNTYSIEHSCTPSACISRRTSIPHAAVV